ncbi:MAG: histidine triad nucleotide-binding protein [Clostridia bacterium]|nr:histidine triad nucleotide-binding protein [Clostridia bacterium]
MDNHQCIFCKIIAGEIPGDRVYEDESALIIRDVNPQAPCHLLVMPKEHMKDISACAGRGDELIGKLFRAAAMAAAKEGLSEKGFRVVTNCGSDACQSVDHFHIHVLGGKQLSERLG